MPVMRTARAVEPGRSACPDQLIACQPDPVWTIGWVLQPGRVQPGASRWASGARQTEAAQSDSNGCQKQAHPRSRNVINSTSTFHLYLEAEGAVTGRLL